MGERVRGRGRIGAAGALIAVLAVSGCGDAGPGPSQPSGGTSATSAEIENGRQIFRHDTFGDEQLWTDVLQMHEVVASHVSPRTALAVGLKVDSDALPPGLLEAADLDDPATTVALLKLDAVVGVKGTVVSEGGRDRLVRLGVTCALCHSTVDNAVQAGIGKRLDGWPNLDLDPGAIISLSPALTSDQKAVYQSWGKGLYDPRFNIDRQSTPLVIPPAYGLRGVPFATFTADGDVRYWNNYVAVTQMGGQGGFRDDRIGVDRPLPAGVPDLVGPKLDALVAYQLSLDAPAPPQGSFDAAAAGRGRNVFEQSCARCHSGATRSDGQLHAPAETGMDPAYANRTATKLHRTTPLRGLWQHPPYFHDGKAPTLAAVVDHYDTVLRLRLSPQQKTDLVEYLKSI
jgi:mono/diheme cytochrome c family protein